MLKRRKLTKYKLGFVIEIITTVVCVSRTIIISTTIITINRSQIIITNDKHNGGYDNNSNYNTS